MYYCVLCTLFKILFLFVNQERPCWDESESMVYPYSSKYLLMQSLESLLGKELVRLSEKLKPERGEKKTIIKKIKGSKNGVSGKN